MIHKCALTLWPELECLSDQDEHTLPDHEVELCKTAFLKTWDWNTKILITLLRSLSNKYGIGNPMNVSAMKDLHYKWLWWLKILSKLDKPLGECKNVQLSQVL